ncbi:isocitrate lyase/phosphoenolpyruvate mutase family protein [Streptomyces sp. CBMA152]|uniref:isocitrate lyase/phosphoenolpyruvate mutase family protein n=1 Tax=Streptomyces sp. CBMA152 TaxID=1896312 RepID=UPI001660323A|nr:isocitrate lyase/phosphoenolpyruvate mutase family protein [Streptomyces sp. CBMA152]MBD0741648.1 phosphoenolpyruvate phosphomutase [Streptomyces sp. CBMA152]
MHSRSAEALRSALEGREQARPLLAVGAANALAARLAADGGFDALWVSGLEVSAAYGLPDANVLGPRDLADTVVAVTRVTDLPVIVDMDNAGGAAHIAERYADDLLRSGATALCIEDSAYPKCNSFAAHTSQRLAEQDLLCRQLEAIRKRAGHDVVLIARTEALVTGANLDVAMEHARAYAEAGADAVLIHSKDASGRQALDISRTWCLDLPLASVPTAFPQITADQLGEAGYRLCIYANHLSRAALAAMRGAIRHFGTAGTFTSSMGAPLAEVGDLLRIGEPGAVSCI